MTDTEKRLAEIREREQAATPGPWEWNEDRFHGGYSGITGKDNAEVLFPSCCNDGDEGAAWFEDFPRKEDAAFIAHAREDIPYLLSEIDRLIAENAAMKEATKRNEPLPCLEKTANRGLDVSGEYDIDYNLICPTCGAVVGDSELNELNGEFCHNCGQALALPAQPENEEPHAE